MLKISELCEDCAIANEIDNEIDKAWTNIPGIHDNGPRDHGVWRLTLTAYSSTNLSLEMSTASSFSYRFKIFLHFIRFGLIYVHSMRT